MNELIQSIERRQLRQGLPPFRMGDRVRVHFQVVEGTRRRTQVFEGVVIRLQGPGARRTFTVRKLSFGVGVERTFPLHSPKIERVEVVARGEVRRAKLYYLRGRIGRRARVRERRDFVPEELAAAEAAVGDAGPDGRRRRPRTECPGRRASRRLPSGAERGGRRRPKPRRRKTRRRAEADAEERAEPSEPSRLSRGRPGPRLTTEERGLAAAPGALRAAAPASPRSSLLELVLIVAAALGLALLIQAFLVKPYRIPSESMEPTLDVGERVLVNRVNYQLERPRPGRHRRLPSPEGRRRGQASAGCRRPSPDQPCPRPTEKRSDVNFIKRVVALPGDTLAIRDGHAVVNGKVQDEPFTGTLRIGRRMLASRRPIKVPPDHFFMMGDNRGASDDSRFWGPVPKKWIIGQAFFTYWPVETDRHPLRHRPQAAGARRAGCSASTARSTRRFVAGADEAGRGSLAGPLVAAAVLFDYERLTPREVRSLSRPGRLEGARRRGSARCSTRSCSGCRPRDRHLALRARHRRARTARDQPRGAARLPGAGRAAGRASASSTASGSTDFGSDSRQ